MVIRIHPRHLFSQIEKTSEHFRKRIYAVRTLMRETHLERKCNKNSRRRNSMLALPRNHQKARTWSRKILEDTLSIREVELKHKRTQMEMPDSATNDKTFQLQRWCAKTMRRKCPDRFYTKRHSPNGRDFLCIRKAGHPASPE